MSQMPIDANVVLTADTSQYDASMQGSAASTESVIKVVDSLTQKIDSLTKSAGRKMLGFAAADVASITAGTAAYAAFERQMTSLSAQAAVLNRGMEDQKRTMTGYVSSVNGLRAAFGTSTAEAAALVQNVTALSDKTASVDQLATTFTKLGAATQESAVSLQSSMNQFQRSMGVPQRDTEKLANQLTVLSAKSGQSAQSILDFSQQLAPIGRAVGMTSTDILGISTAFNKAGQDGFQAASGFTRMMTDIAHATQTGSPDLQKYSNLVGMTVEQFKNLGGTDQYLKIFEALNRQGPQAITTLNRLGYDGIRMQKSIQAMAQQGGPGAEIAQARAADPNAMTRGSTAAFSGIVDSLAKLRSELAMTAESFGSVFEGPAKAFIGTLSSIARVGREMMDSPLGKLAAWAMGLAAPFAAAAGAIALTAKAVLGASSAFMILGGSQTRGFIEGRQRFGGLGSSNMGPIGAGLDARGNFIQRPLYAMGHALGSAMPASRNADGRSRYAEWAYRNSGGRFGTAPPAPGMISRGLGWGMTGMGWGTRNLVGAQFSSLYGGIPGLPGALGKNSIDDLSQRERVFNRASVWDYKPREALGTGVQKLSNLWSGRTSAYNDEWNAARQAVMTAGSGAMDDFRKAGGVDLSNADAVKNAIRGGVTGPSAADTKQAILKGGDEYQRAQQRLAKVSNTTADAMDKTTKSTMSFSRGLGNLTRGLAGTMGAAGSAAMGGAQLVGRTAGRGLLNAGMGLFGGPLGLGIAAGLGGWGIYDAMRDKSEFQLSDMSGFNSGYMEAGGIAAPTAFNPTYASQSAAVTLSSSRQVSTTDVRAATGSGYKLTNSMIDGLSAEDAMARIGPSFSMMKNNPKALNSLKLDLINQYGGVQAQRMIGQLAASEGFDATSLVKTAMADGMSNSERGDAWSAYAGTLEDQQNFVASSDPQAAARMTATQFQGALTAFADVAGSNLNRQRHGSRTGQISYSDPISDQRRGFGSMLGKQFFNVDLSEDQAKSLDFGSGTIEDFLAINVFGDKAVFDEEQRKMVLGMYGANPELLGQEGIDAVMAGMSGSGFQVAGKTVGERIAGSSAGKAFNLYSAQQAIAEPGNINTQLTAVRDMVQSMREAGKSAPAITRILGEARAIAGTASEPEYQLAAAAQAANQRYQQFSLAGAGRTERFASATADYRAMMLIPEGDEARDQLQQGAEDQMFAAAEDQRQYFQSLLTQQREFNISRNRAEEDFDLQRERMDYSYELQRERAQDDFHQQRQWQEEDFQLSRQRGEFDFELMRARAVEDNHRQIQRAQDDFDRSRRRQERDFQHQVMLMTEQTAMQAANIYQRTQVQRTSSASWLLFNADEQLQDMRGQSKDLRKVRRMGLTDDAIQQLDLTNPKNAQQLSRMVVDLANNPEMVREFNRAVAKRLRAARDLTTDESSTQWQEFTRQHRMSMRRAQSDFDRQLRRGRDDFRRSLDRQNDDFRRSMSRQEDDFEKSMDRGAHQFDLQLDRMAEDYDVSTEQMTDDFEKSMKRAASDLNRMAKTIDGDLADMLTKATNRLSGHARKQAETVLGEFKGLRQATGSEAVDLMQSLADIFGVKYRAPKLGTPIEQNYNRIPEGMAGGGVLPGRSIGRDDMHFYSPSHGKLSLAGGEAIMVPEWVDMVGGPAKVRELNDAARYKRSFASGGVTPAPGEWHQHTSGYPWARWSGDINVPGSGDYGNPVKAWKTGQVADVERWNSSYGHHVRINHPGSNEETLYAHLSQIAVKVGQIVQAGQQIGAVGSTGNSSGPHLHFEIKGGTGAIDMGGSSQMASLASILSPDYPAVERAANMSQVNPLRRGQMSGIINQMARLAYKKMSRRAGRAADTGETGLGQAPMNGTGNVALGERMAANWGWTGGQWDSLYQLWQNESGWRTNADNPTSSAYGIPQAMTSVHNMPTGYFTDPEVQIRWGLNYIKDRYGSPTNAWQQWNARDPHWYGDGAILARGGATTIGVGERGGEIVMPLDRKGVDFLASLMTKMSPGLEARNVNTHGYTQPMSAHQIHTYNIDRSTTFSGPITVQANDPSQFISQLRNRERARALTQPAIGGSRV